MAETKLPHIPSGSPEQGRIVQPRSLTQALGTNFGGVQMSTVSSILRNAERGDLEKLSDLIEHMVASDAHVRSLYGTRLNAVAGSEWEIEPGRAKSGEEDVAEVAAEFIREELELHPDVNRMFSDLLHAVAVGASVLEHRWFRDGGRWRTEPAWTHPRDIRYNRDWQVEMRTYLEGTRAKWIKTSEHPNKFIIHNPRPFNAAPTKTGELLSCIWLWLFKRWNERFRNVYSERHALPLHVGILPENARGNVRENLQEGLEALSFDHIAVFESGTDIKVIEPSGDAGASLNDIINHINGEMSKAYLGSGLNVEVTVGGGNRALGESQFDTTMLPRLLADARRLANTLERDLFKPLLMFNTHLFGGRMPPIPRMVFRLIKDETKEIPVGMATLAVGAGVVKIDELRVATGLDPLGDAAGGNEFVAPMNPAGGLPDEQPDAALSDTPPGGADCCSPLATGHPTVANGRTSSASRPTPLELAFAGRLGTSET